MKKLLFLSIFFVGFLFIRPAHAVVEISDGSVQALWHLEDTADSSGNGLTLTLGGNATTTAGKLGLAFKFDGVGDFTNAGNVLPFERTDVFSVAMWMLASSTGQKCLVCKADQGASTARGYQLRHGAGDQLQFRLANNADGGNRLWLTSTNAVTTSTWHHVVFRYTGNSACTGVDMYVDGAYVAKTCATDALTLTTVSADALRLGDDTSGSMDFHGMLDEVVITTSTIMSTTTIVALYNGGAGDEVCTTVGCGSPAAEEPNRSVIIILETLREKLKELSELLTKFV